MDESSGMKTDRDTLERWIDHLGRVAGPVVGAADLGSELRESLARPRWIGGPLLAWQWVRRHGSLLPQFPPEACDASVRVSRDDAALWWALMHEDAGPVDRWVDLDGAGPLFKQDLYRTIEVWTETELSALHALSHHARRGSPKEAALLTQRLWNAVGWHLSHTQPDNATNHPWAVHVFLLHGTPESHHFAETLASNCMVMHGKPDPLSAWILLDAADLLAAHLS